MNLKSYDTKKVLKFSQKVICSDLIDESLRYDKTIVIVSDTWSPDINGVVTTLENMVLELIKLNYKVELITPDRFQTISSPLYPEVRLSIAAEKIEDMISSINPDALYIATEGPLGFAARKYAQKNHFPYATGYHTRFPIYLKKYLFIPEILTYWLMQWFHRKSSTVLVPTKSLTDSLRAKGFSNVKAWTRGVDENQFFITSINKKDGLLDDRYERPIFLYVGRIAPEKNLTAFLDLNLPGTKLLVGEGPNKRKLENKYRHQIESKKIIFLGKQKGLNLSKIYSASDVFIFPSKTDTFGLVILEALASGLPVAAYPVAESLDVIGDCKCGFLNNNLEKAALMAYQAISTNEITPADCREYAIKNYTWSRTAELFVDYMNFV